MKNSVYDIFDNVSEKKFPGFKKVIHLYMISSYFFLYRLSLAADGIPFADHLAGMYSRTK